MGLVNFSVPHTKTLLYSKFEGLQVTYQVLLIQEGLRLSGIGEKLSDRGSKQIAKDYVGVDRPRIHITGNVTHNYFSRDLVVIHYKEDGELPESSTVHRLVHFGRETMSGHFWTTIANTTGPVLWQRSASVIDYEPVVPPEVE